jgi:hypothetical protein
LNHQLTEYLAKVPLPRRHKREQTIRQYRLRRRLTPAQLEEVVAAYQAGTTAAELAHHWAVSKSALLAQLRSAGVSIRYPRLTASELLRIVELYQQGARQIEIACAVGRSSGTIWHALERAGLVGRKQRDHCPEF